LLSNGRVRITIIVNAGAGTAAGQDCGVLCGRIEALCAELGLDARVVAAPSDRIADAIERAAADPSVDAVVLGGGDGTVSGGAARLAESGKVMGVLPLGTLNHFAHDLGMPDDLAESLRVIAAGATRAVDLAEVNGRVFLNNCSIGLYPSAVRQRERLRRLHGTAKWTAMARGAWDSLRRFRVFRLTLQFPDGARRLSTPQLVVGNNRYETRFLTLGKRPSLDCGQLWVYAARDRGRFGFVRLVLRAMVGRLDQERDFEQTPTPELEIHERRGARRVFLALDGELAALAAPLRFRSRPGALTVIAPAPAPATEPSAA
jgi:diacylglycerol kinase family enzyme